MGFSPESVAAFIAVLGLLSIVAQVSRIHANKGFLLHYFIIEGWCWMWLFFPPTDCSVKFTHAFHREQEHNFAGSGISDSATRLVRVRIWAMVRPKASVLNKSRKKKCLVNNGINDGLFLFLLNCCFKSNVNIQWIFTNEIVPNFQDDVGGRSRCRHV